MKVLYPSAKTALLRGQMDLEVDTFKAQLTTGAFYDDTHVVIGDVTGLIGTAVTLTGITVTDGVATMADVVFPNVTGTDHANGVVAYQDGSGALLSYTDQRRDTVPIDVTPTGGDVTLSFDYLVKI